MSHLVLVIADGQDWCRVLIRDLAWERVVVLRERLDTCEDRQERTTLTRALCEARALYDQVEG